MMPKAYTTIHADKEDSLLFEIRRFDDFVVLQIEVGDCAFKIFVSGDSADNAVARVLTAMSHATLV